jgi:hypothetical protein
LSAIEFAFFVSHGEPLTTTKLMRACYAYEDILGKIKPWHRTNTIKAARKVATPIGRATTRGRPIIWRLDSKRPARVARSCGSIL